MSQRPASIAFLASLALAGQLLSACQLLCLFGDGNNCDSPPIVGGNDNTQDIRIVLEQQLSTAYREVQLDITKIEAKRYSDHDFTMVGSPSAPLSLVGTAAVPVLDANVPTPSYGNNWYFWIRLTFGTKSTLTLPDGSTVPLEMPSASMQPMTFQADFPMHGAERVDWKLTFDADNIATRVTANGQTSHVFIPHVDASDFLDPNNQFQLVDAATNAPLSNLLVTDYDYFGPFAFRRRKTDASGLFHEPNALPAYAQAKNGVLLYGRLDWTNTSAMKLRVSQALDNGTITVRRSAPPSPGGDAVLLVHYIKNPQPGSTAFDQFPMSAQMVPVTDGQVEAVSFQNLSFNVAGTDYYQAVWFSVAPTKDGSMWSETNIGSDPVLVSAEQPAADVLIGPTGPTVL